MLLQDKKALIFGVANERSIAYGISDQFKQNGARLAFSYANDAIKKRVAPINEKLDGEFTMPCDVTDDAAIAQSVETVKEKWGTVDVLVHCIAFAKREELQGRFIDTSRDGFALAMDVSAYSLVALAKAYEPLLSENASILTLTYFGSEKVIHNYNVMGVAKATLEACVRYLAMDLGRTGKRINAISAGPLKTLASSGISGFKTILKHVEETAPLRRNVTQDEVGRTAAYLASDMAAGVTGEVLHVDSGYNIVGLTL